MTIFDQFLTFFEFDKQFYQFRISSRLGDKHRQRLRPTV